jgi:hypothetical protein
MKQSPSWQADSRFAVQEISRLLRIPKFHYRVPNSRHLPLPWAKLILHAHSRPSSLKSIWILSSRLFLVFSSLYVFRQKFFTNFSYLPLCSTYPVLHILLYLINPTIFDKEMYTVHEPPYCARFSVSLLFHSSQVQIFSSVLCSQTPSKYILTLMWENKFTHTNQPVKS